MKFFAVFLAPTLRLFGGSRIILFIFNAKLISFFCIFTIVAPRYYHCAFLCCKTRIHHSCILFTHPALAFFLINRRFDCVAVVLLFFNFRMTAIFIRNIHCLPFDQADRWCYIQLSHRELCHGKSRWHEGGNHPSPSSRFRQAWGRRPAPGTQRFREKSKN